jgi:UDP:flavonoid glycosyltransferase YjiC (YdhE family)
MRGNRRRTIAAPHAGPSNGPVVALDIVFAADLSVTSMHGLRVAAETSAAAKAGYRIGLLHLAADDGGGVIAPEIQRIARLPSVTVLQPGAPASTHLLIRHAGLSSVDCGPVTAVAAAATIVVAPPGSAESSSPGTMVVTNDRWPVVAASGSPSPPQTDKPMRLGIVVTAGDAAAGERLLRMVPPAGECKIIIWQRRAAAAEPLSLPPEWTVLRGSEVAFDWFLRKLDALLFVGDGSNAAPPAELLAAALAAGKILALPPAIAADFGDAAVMAEPRSAIARLLEIWNTPGAAAKRATKARSHAARHYSEAAFVKKLAKLARLPAPQQLSRPKPKSAGPPRILFMPKGGVGIGHVARTLAVARRARGRFVPVFATLSEQAGLIERFGYRAEYIPSAVYAGLEQSDWQPWFKTEVSDLIDDYGIGTVVFDGSDPSPALAAAVAAKSNCRLAWLRRGMWQAGFDPSPIAAELFDLIVEPGDLAAARDAGVTAERRHEVEPVAPIRLLDRHELLDRADAAHALGLDSARPSVLLQLGSGENRDIVAMLDVIAVELEKFDGLQIAVAEWPNASASLRLWKNTRVLKGAPLSLYFNAFDFTIAAAGYNTFHEVMAFGLPAVFIPNSSPGMDDQLSRAEFAQDAGAAVTLHQDNLDDLANVLQLMMNAKARALLRQNCLAMNGANGAEAASDLIARLAN